MCVGVPKILIQRWMGVGDGRMRLQSIRIVDVDRFDGRQGRRRGLGWGRRHRVRFYPGRARDEADTGRLTVAAEQVLDQLISFLQNLMNIARLMFRLEVRASDTHGTR